MKQDIKVNRKYKDRLFRFVFKEPKELLSLYNAINGTDYQNSDDLIINTMEDAIYLSMKNDVSFLIRGILNLYEHQSTWNPNMPFRNFLYVADLLKGYIAENDFDIYGSRPILIPTPIAVVFYNGVEEHPERSILKLSDLYEVKDQKGSLEFETLVLNINYGKNKELMEKCRTLMEYSMFIDRIRKYKEMYIKVEDAVERAIDECIKANILIDILKKHRNEVFNMILTEYDEQAHIRHEKEWSREEGEIVAEVRLIRRKLEQGMKIDEIAEWMELDPKYIDRIAQLCKQNPKWDNTEVAERLIQEKN